MSQKPWRGIHVATALPFHDDLSVDYDGFADHVRWLADNGMDGVAPNGSLGEYHSLTMTSVLVSSRSPSRRRRRDSA
jgi:1-pyrroline-4-hydroxy-2-carboxylate deaminase